MSTPHLRVEEVPVAVILPLRAAVLRPGQPADAARFDGDDTALHLALFADVGGEHDATRSDVVACLSVRAAPRDGEPRQLRGMAVAQAWQGRGLGGALLLAAHGRISAPMWCNARLRAVPFYARHGWVVDSAVFDIAGIGPHHRMSWNPEPPRA